MADDSQLSLVGVAGAILGFVGKSLWDRYLKKQDGIQEVYQKYRDPLILSAVELVYRLQEINEHYPTVYLRSEVMALSPKFQEENNITDPYFQKYKLISTAYRFCALFGWLELFRKDAIYLHTGKNLAVDDLEACAELLRADVADGQLNTSDDWEDWKDTLIFREELRAIGESMIDEKGKMIIGYGRFIELFEADGAGRQSRWIQVATNFFLDLQVTKKDFRKIRLQRLAIHLVDLIQLLDSARMSSRLQGIRQTQQSNLISAKMPPL
jgi:hypothetical protein